MNARLAGAAEAIRLLGFRTYAGRLGPTADGIEVPLVLIPSDRAYLEQVGSFVVPFVDVFYGPGKRAPVNVGRWSRLLDADSAPVRFDSAAAWERVNRLRRAEAEHPSILQALSEDTIRKLTGKGFLMDVPAGQLLTEKGLTQREIFVILNGVFDVHDGDRRSGLRRRGPVRAGARARRSGGHSGFLTAGFLTAWAAAEAGLSSRSVRQARTWPAPRRRAGSRPRSARARP
jgi:hypothetical protein